MPHAILDNQSRSPPSPSTSHADSTGPPLSDLASLSDSTGWISDEADDAASYDMVASHDFSQVSGHSRSNSAESESSVTSGSDRLGLSFPDPLSSSASVSDAASVADSHDHGIDDDDDGESGYSFLFDAKQPERESSFAATTVTAGPPLKRAVANNLRADAVNDTDSAVSSWLEATKLVQPNKERSTSEPEQPRSASMQGDKAPRAEPHELTRLRFAILDGTPDEAAALSTRLAQTSGLQLSATSVEDLAADEPCLLVTFEAEQAFLRTSAFERLNGAKLLVVSSSASMSTSLASVATSASSTTVRPSALGSACATPTGSVLGPSMTRIVHWPDAAGISRTSVTLQELQDMPDSALVKALTNACKSPAFETAGLTASNTRATEQQDQDQPASSSRWLSPRSLILLSVAVALAAATARTHFSTLHGISTPAQSATYCPEPQLSAPTSTSVPTLPSAPAMRHMPLLGAAPPAIDCLQTGSRACALSVPDRRTAMVASRPAAARREKLAFEPVRKTDSPPSLFGLGNDEVFGATRRRGQPKAKMPRRRRRESITRARSVRAKSPPPPTIREAIGIVGQEARSRGSDIWRDFERRHGELAGGTRSLAVHRARALRTVAEKRLKAAGFTAVKAGRDVHRRVDKASHAYGPRVRQAAQAKLRDFARLSKHRASVRRAEACKLLAAAKSNAVKVGRGARNRVNDATRSCGPRARQAAKDKLRVLALEARRRVRAAQHECSNRGTAVGRRAIGLAELHVKRAAVGLRALRRSGLDRHRAKQQA